ncbi:MAG TPA: TPM domain-containing protein [Bacteroidia bacterium]|nr:TPM domain-containing protein [Bacteroidia bacterium]
MSKNFFSPEERGRIIAAIKEAERQTSGEIRLFIEPHCKVEVLDRAAFIFHKLGIDNTKDRNGVLIYIAFRDKKFAIIGDAGINAVVEKNFWDIIKEDMQNHFAEGKYAEGLSTSIQRSGEALKKYFPYVAGDKNELSDEIALG